MEQNLSNSMAFLTQSDLYNAFLIFDCKEDQETTNNESLGFRLQNQKKIFKERIQLISEQQNNLDLNSCQIQQLDFSIADQQKLSQIKTMEINNNQIRKIKGLDSCINLKRLYIQNNGLNSIFFQLQILQLKFIDLSNNNIQSIEPFAVCLQLKTLLINNNIISNLIQFIKELKKIKKIKKIEIKHNPICLEHQYKYKIIYYVQNLKKINGQNIIEGDWIIAQEILKQKQETQEDNLFYSQVFDVNKNNKIWIQKLNKLNKEEIKSKGNLSSINNFNKSSLFDSDSFLTQNNQQKNEENKDIKSLLFQLQQKQNFIDEQNEKIKQLQILNDIQTKQIENYEKLYGKQDKEQQIQQAEIQREKENSEEENMDDFLQQAFQQISEAKNMLKEIQENKKKQNLNSQSKYV